MSKAAAWTPYNRKQVRSAVELDERVMKVGNKSRAKMDADNEAEMERITAMLRAGQEERPVWPR